VPQGNWQTITFVAGLRHDAMVAPFVINGAMNGASFLAYLEQCLVPTLKPDDVVIIDNLTAHHVFADRLLLSSKTCAVEADFSISLPPIVLPLLYRHWPRAKRQLLRSG